MLNFLQFLKSELSSARMAPAQPLPRKSSPDFTNIAPILLIVLGVLLLILLLFISFFLARALIRRLRARAPVLPTIQSEKPATPTSTGSRLTMFCARFYLVKTDVPSVAPPPKRTTTISPDIDSASDSSVHIVAAVSIPKSLSVVVQDAEESSPISQVSECTVPKVSDSPVSDSLPFS